jgi:hypothetical protein
MTDTHGSGRFERTPTRVVFAGYFAAYLFSQLRLAAPTNFSAK